MKHPFDYAKWRKNHGKHHKVLVRELILALEMNEKSTIPLDSYDTNDARMQWMVLKSIK